MLLNQSACIIWTTPTKENGCAHDSTAIRVRLFTSMSCHVVACSVYFKNDNNLIRVSENHKHWVPCALPGLGGPSSSFILGQKVGWKPKVIVLLRGQNLRRWWRREGSSKELQSKLNKFDRLCSISEQKSIIYWLYSNNSHSILCVLLHLLLNIRNNM